MKETAIKKQVSLTPHPVHRPIVDAIDVDVELSRNGRLSFDFVMRGSIAAVRVPAASVPRRGDRLWEHTCFEVFVRQREEPAYYEFNFSPSGEWAVYEFKVYRDGESLNFYNRLPGIAVRAKAQLFVLSASIELAGLARLRPGTIDLALSAVIETSSGELAYWALKHASPSKPDFHHPDGFTLSLDFPGCDENV